MANPPKLTKKQRAAVAEIRAKKYSASYEKRLIRGVQSGKTRQQSRGHVVKEHVVRKERERERNEGLSSSEIKSIRNWYSKFNPDNRKPIPDVEDVIDFARQEGYQNFKTYRQTWNAARSVYLRELKAGTYESRGLGYLEMLTDMANVRSHGSIEWLYYH